jgi:hypothetical protein
MVLSISFGLLILGVVVFLLLRLTCKSDFGLFINPIKGIMVGALYDSEDYYEEDAIREHTIQILIFFVSFMFIWETTLNTDDE